MRKPLCALAFGALLCVDGSPARAADDAGKALLTARCGRCHAIAANEKSRLKNAPNLWDTLRSYPTDRLEFELAEGIGSRHIPMPQIQFTSDEITLITAYLQVE
ncbi:cytochrome c [Hyphomicrobium sp.]|uniref:c-type cytochrome n=1 Tax=Hyphomicrobium sp. TaxID=82 RepID=UPI0025C5230C|nr:cytochrome c [Hyphomicrobium sp.]MCC7252724.1 cytochrome c [Hyphomicrobium sp.]